MQEIKKRRIVIASVLKPVNDTRMFEKLGLTLSKVADVHIAGYPATAASAGSVVFHASRPFSRLSLQRLLQPWRVYWLLTRLQPGDVIASSHEILFPAVLYKLIYQCDVYYDLQENYKRNIMYTEAFSRVLRPLLAFYVRLKERCLHGFISKYLVAEKSYLDEMPFIRSKSIVLENRFANPPGGTASSRLAKNSRKTLIFSGTLSRSTGIFGAIALTKELWALDSAIRLTISGFCPRAVEYRELLKEIEGCHYITLHGGNVLLPHAEIVRHIRESDFGVIAYKITPATENRIPTKLFEYLANGLSIITTAHPPWLSFTRQYEEPIIFDPALPDAISVLAKISTHSETQVVNRSGLLWAELEPDLLDLFSPPNG